MNDRDPSQNPNPPQCELKETLNGSTVEVYNLDALIHPTGEPHNITRIFDRSDFGGNIGRATIDHQFVELESGETGMALTLTILLDQLQDQTTWINSAKNAINTTNISSRRFYEAKPVVFNNTLGVAVEGGLRLVAWFDAPEKRVVVSNFVNLISRSEDDQKKLKLEPAPLSSFEGEAQLSCFGKFMIETLDRTNRPPHSTSAKDLRRTYKIGETLRAAPTERAPQVGRTATSKNVRRSNGDETELNIPEIVDLAPSEAVTLNDVGGNAQLKNHLKDIALSFKNAEIMAKWGASRPQGVLLYGEPGTGKTMLATALANEIGAELWKVQSSDIYVKWLGASEQKIKQLFISMRKLNRPTVVLFDEFDAIVGITADPTSGGADNARNSVAGIFKQEMNTLAQENPNVLIVATTNHPDRIDQSLIRSGRFDHRIYVPMPDDDARSEIIIAIMAKRMLGAESDDFKIFADDIKVSELVKQTDEFSGADIAEIFRRLGLAKAMLEARTGEATPISQQEFRAAIEEFRREKS